MINKDYKDCEPCRYMIEGFHNDLCRAMQLPKPVAYMRSPLSQCGPEKMLFEPKRKYSELDDE